MPANSARIRQRYARHPRITIDDCLPTPTDSSTTLQCARCTLPAHAELGQAGPGDDNALSPFVRGTRGTRTPPRLTRHQRQGTVEGPGGSRRLVAKSDQNNLPRRLRVARPAGRVWRAVEHGSHRCSSGRSEPPTEAPKLGMETSYALERVAASREGARKPVSPRRESGTRAERNRSLKTAQCVKSQCNMHPVRGIDCDAAVVLRHHETGRLFETGSG
jgi:hypothetical protein